MILIRRIIILLICFLICSCGYSAQSYIPRLLSSERIYIKNYELESYQTTFTGNPMITVKDYYVEKYGSIYLVPEHDITLSFGRAKYMFKMNKKYKIEKKTLINNQEFYMIKYYPEGTQIFFLVSEDGSFENYSLIYIPAYGTYSKSLQRYDIQPTNAKLSLLQDDSIDPKKNYENYELIYSGIDKDSIKLTYREYTPDNFARVAFFQSLSYPINSATIRFKEIRLKLKEVTPESITFKVLEDGVGG